MHQILRGLLYHVDVSIYAKPEFNVTQMYWIVGGLYHGIDVSIYAKPELDAEQMEDFYFDLLGNKNDTSAINADIEEPLEECTGAQTGDKVKSSSTDDLKTISSFDK